MYYREEFAYNCAMSLVNTTKLPINTHVTIAFGVNKSSDELIQQLQEITNIGSDNLSIRLFNFNENLGKASVVNKISRMFEFDYLISMDGDMVCVQSDWLIHMIRAYSEFTHRFPKKPLGALCCNQIGNCCHAIKMTDPTTMVCKLSNYTLIGNVENEGIAGGVLMTASSVWNAIGGYDDTKVYGGDDGYYCNQTLIRNHVAMYLQEVSFYHPYDVNKKYQQWKRDRLNEINDNKITSTEDRKGYFK